LVHRSTSAVAPAAHGPRTDSKKGSPKGGALVEAAPRDTGRRPYTVLSDPGGLELAGEYKAAVMGAVFAALPSSVARQPDQKRLP